MVSGNWLHMPMNVFQLLADCFCGAAYFCAYVVWQTDIFFPEQ